MVSRAPNVIDLASYRERRGHHEAPAQALPFDAMQGGSVFVMPVLLPVMFGWFPVWVVGAFVNCRTADE